MKAHIATIGAGALFAGSLATGTAAAHAIDDALFPLTDSLMQGKVSLDVRYRFEQVDQDRPASILDEASAQTVRTRLGWRTGLFHGFFAYGEAENVSVVGEEDYNNTYNGKTRFPVVADPDGTEVNQAYLGYLGLKGNTFRYGRQAFFFDNHRFVGDVGWRQNQQTFDSFFYENKMLPGVTGSYAYVYNVNRVFGEDTPNGAFANTGDLQHGRASDQPAMEAKSGHHADRLRLPARLRRLRGGVHRHLWPARDGRNPVAAAEIADPARRRRFGHPVHRRVRPPERLRRQCRQFRSGLRPAGRRRAPVWRQLQGRLRAAGRRRHERHPRPADAARPRCMPSTAGRISSCARRRRV